MAGIKKSEAQRQRIISDIKQFYENVKQVQKAGENADVVDIACRYCEDARYFCEKGDYMTAFGCINYAHGLIDALRKKWRQ
ncbi:MAG: DUF357 domain-containing protein [Candidatus Micrarchaeota archaeon]|nr:DUF357 domain-containing protein [Candidatus Micrarchaeota archaeon]